MTTIAPPRSRTTGNKVGVWLFFASVAALATLPILQRINPDLVTNARLFSFTQMFMLVTLASAWNLTGGMTGYVDFGFAVFFGVGAYGTGIMMREGWPFWAACIAGAVFAAVFAVLIGMPTLRLRGPYFSIAMLGTFVAMREIVRVAKPLTGGGVGLTLPPYLNRPLFFYLMLALSVIAIGIAWWIRRSEFGSTLIAIREDEIGAEMRGINTTVNKIAVFAVAAFIGGVVGGMWAYQNTFIDPDVVFIESRTVELVMMAILGGLGTVMGPVVGAALIYWMRDIVWANLLDYHLIAEGLLLIVIVLFVPNGIMGLFGDKSGTSLQRVWRSVTGRKVPER